MRASYRVARGCGLLLHRASDITTGALHSRGVMSRRGPTPTGAPQNDFEVKDEDEDSKKTAVLNFLYFFLGLIGRRRGEFDG